MIRPIRSLVLLAFVLAPSLRASVLVVAGFGTPYNSTQAAVLAAADGDTVLVRPGSYSGFTVASKSLTISADPPGSVTLTTAVTITGTAAIQPVVLTGFNVALAPFGAVQVIGCAGPVRLESLTSLPDPNGAMPDMFAVRVDGSPDVAILRSNLAGSSAWPMAFFEHAAAAVLVSNSRVAIYDCNLAGGSGGNGYFIGTQFPADPGEPACRVTSNGQLFASGSTFQGGAGGMGPAAVCPPSFPQLGGAGGSGGEGLRVDAGSQATLVDDTVTGGPGGAGGAAAQGCGLAGGPAGVAGLPWSGNVISLSALSRHVAMGTLVRELAPITVTLTGQPGDLVWLQIGGTPTWALDTAFSGVRLVSTAQRSTRIFLGTVPASGMITQTFVFPDMGPSVEARTNYVQALFRDASGANVLGTGEVFTLVDSAF